MVSYDLVSAATMYGDVLGAVSLKRYAKTDVETRMRRDVFGQYSGSKQCSAVSAYQCLRACLCGADGHYDGLDDIDYNHFRANDKWPRGWKL